MIIENNTLLVSVDDNDIDDNGLLAIPNGIQAIANYAVQGKQMLRNVIIPDSVTEIGACAFTGCSSLTNATIPDSVVSMGYGAFCGCAKLDHLYLPASLKHIGAEILWGCPDAAIYLEDTPGDGWSKQWNHTATKDINYTTYVPRDYITDAER